MKLSDKEHALVLTMHHIISDGWSLGVITQELASLYQAFTKDEDSPLPELVVQYADFANWQREWLTGEVLDNQITYWKKQLGQIPILNCPRIGHVRRCRVFAARAGSLRCLKI